MAHSAQNDDGSQGMSMWVHVLKRLHAEMTALLASSGSTRHLDAALSFLDTAALLGADTAAYSGTYVAAADAFVEQEGKQKELRERLDMGGVLQPAEWVDLAYAASISRLLGADWEELYQSPLLAEEARERGRAVRVIVDRFSYARALELLERQWRDTGSDIMSQVAPLLFIRSCAVMGLYAPTALYEEVASRLSLRNHFLVVYLAASCLKLGDVSRRIDVSSWSNEQYACMMLLDTFNSLPGTAWG